jgi:hypothetical protein
METFTDEQLTAMDQPPHLHVYLELFDSAPGSRSFRCRGCGWIRVVKFKPTASSEDLDQQIADQDRDFQRRGLLP